MMSTRFRHLAERGLLRVDDAWLAAQEFVWLVLSIPLNRAMLSGDEGFTDEELERFSDEAARVFLAAYGARSPAHGKDTRRPKPDTSTRKDRR